MALKAVVTLESTSLEEKDNVTNTFTLGGTWSGEDLDPITEAALLDAFRNFYNVTPTGAVAGNPVGTFLSSVLSRAANANRLDIYDITGHLDGSNHGSPVSSMLWTLTPASATAFPSEVALCLTMESAGRADAPVEAPDGIDPGFAIDRPQQRHTGRIYVGPLATSAGAVVGGIARPAAGFTDAVRKAFNDLCLDVGAAVPAGKTGNVGIWSRADATIRPVAFCSTDDAWDTQRRRGEGPTARERLAIG